MLMWQLRDSSDVKRNTDSIKTNPQNKRQIYMLLMTSYLPQTQYSVLEILVSVYQQRALFELTLYIMHTVTGRDYI